MSNHKDVVHNYQPGDVVYVVSDYKVNKAIVESVVVTFTKTGRTISYNIYDYRQKDAKEKKVRSISEAYLVDDLITALASARINWKKIVDGVNQAHDIMTDAVFEPVEENKEEDGSK